MIATKLQKLLVYLQAKRKRADHEVMPPKKNKIKTRKDI